MMDFPGVLQDSKLEGGALPRFRRFPNGIDSRYQAADLDHLAATLWDRYFAKIAFRMWQ